jgi:hypothetical protein
LLIVGMLSSCSSCIPESLDDLPSSTLEVQLTVAVQKGTFSVND